ncbi:MAG: fibronectin type III domain-containing protein [Cyanobacteria bacterium]|nr:fibronectin type III domain-containing protein [Cyanobacteriota bacterium]
MRPLYVLAIIAAGVGCGRKGPPLAPFVRVPALVTAVTPQRIGNDVYLTFKVPETNADGQQPADIGAVEIYAVTSAKPPATDEQRDVATLIATLPVRPILPVPPVPANGSPPPPLPLPPGVDRGTTVAVKETLTPETRVAVELPVEKPVNAATPEEPREPFGPLVAPAPTELPRRHYFVIAKSPRGRDSAPSTPVSVPLEGGSSAPGAPSITNTATELTISWTPPADARTATFLLPPSMKPPVGAGTSPSNTTPKLLAPLTAKSLGFNSEATTYHVYDVTPLPTPVADDPYAIKVPPALTAAPIAGAEFVLKGVTFGTERCFEVRPVDVVSGASVIGPASPRTCITPKDTFAPAAPRSLAAIAGAGVINLIWDANGEADLAGYVVLRGEAPGDTLQPVTPEPVTVTSYRDESVRAGTRYVYAVVAVDRAGNRSPQSNRAEETARQ